MRENGAAKKAAKVYEWDGKPVSRSTYFRYQRRSKRRSRSRSIQNGDQPRAALRTALKMHEQVYVRDETMDNERVETFMLIAENVSLGDQNEKVVVTLPRKILTATMLTLKGAGF
jgi:hypothetical protein